MRPHAVHTSSPRTATEVGEHIRIWRTRRGLSQLQAAHECTVSARHLSFVETGRARPSSELIVHLARTLGATNHELNLCLLRGGFAPHHDESLELARTALDDMLEEMIERHNPIPAFIFDANWVMSRINTSGQWLCSILMPRAWAAVGDPRHGVDMIAALTNADGLLSQMRNAPDMGWELLRQLRLEQVTNPRLGERADLLATSLHERYPQHRVSAEPTGAAALMRLEFDSAIGPLSFLKLQNVVGIPQEITIAAPRVEVWLPLDARTQRKLGDQHTVPLGSVG